MIKWFILFLLIPSLCFSDSELTVGGKTAAAHIIQSSGTSLRPRPYLNFTGSITCSDSGGKTVCNATGGGGSSIGGAITGGTPNSILYVSSDSTLAQDNSKFIWKDSTSQMALGTSNTTLDTLTVNANSATYPGFTINYTSTGMPDGTGGTISHVGANTVHKFTGSSTFTPSGTGTITYFICGAGGSGGGWTNGVGGGGSGGECKTSTLAVSSGVPITVTIGSKGLANIESDGGSTVLGAITAVGGAHGGHYQNVAGGTSGHGGGCGGGAAGDNCTGATGTVSFKGGSVSSSSNNPGGTGGGGDSGSGVDNSNSINGTAGGPGTISSIDGVSTQYGCGGGGGARTGGGTGGTGGCSNAGAGGDAGLVGNNATANTGSGGGGAANTGGNPNGGGNGSDGIVMLSYTSAVNFPTLSFYGNSAKTSKIWTDGNNSNQLTLTVGSTDVMTQTTTNTTLNTDLTMADAKNFVFNTTTGSKIGTGTTQKFSFYNATPRVQPTGDIAAALSSLGLVGSVSPSGSVVGTTDTQTLTNKRITKRVVTASDATSITPNTDNADMTYQANTQGVGTLTINADAGTPTNGQSWLLKIKSTNIQTFSWNAIFVGGTTALPTATTGSSKYDYYAFIYDTAKIAWEYTGTAGGF